MPRCPEKQHESPPQECGRGEVVLYINRKARRHCLFRAEVKAKPTCQSGKCFYCVNHKWLLFSRNALIYVFSLCVCLHVKCTHVSLRIWVHVCAILRPEVYVGCLPLFLPTCVLCMCVLPACLVPLEVWMGLLGLEFEPPCRCWELNPGPLEEQSITASHLWASVFESGFSLNLKLTNSLDCWPVITRDSLSCLPPQRYYYRRMPAHPAGTKVAILAGRHCTNFPRLLSNAYI